MRPSTPILVQLSTKEFPYVSFRSKDTGLAPRMMDRQLGRLLVLPQQLNVDFGLGDIEMSIKDGKAAYIELGAAECTSPGLRRRTPVIAAMGNAREEQIAECHSLGFDEFAIKPFRIMDVLRLIDNVLAIRQPDS